MRFQPFLMERMMSEFEQDIAYNLSESGVHPPPLRELLADRPDVMDRLWATELSYPYVNGTPELRANIAALYDRAQAENVLVTVGAAEANYISTRTLLSAGDEIVIMLPNYMQIWGIAKNHDLKIKAFHLLEEDDWAPDLAELEAVVTSDTKLIAVCNPNNPTGRVLTPTEMNRIVACAERVGAWLLADEVYRGATRESDEENPSFYGRYDKVLAVGSMSKAYGLPGLRIGWVVGPSATLNEIWARHEYTTISATKLSNELAAVALSAQVRPRLLQRTRAYVRGGYALLQDWLKDHGKIFTCRPPDAGPIAFIRYHLDVNSSAFVEGLRRRKSVLIVPGDHFELDHFVRIGFGGPQDRLAAALDLIHEYLLEISDQSLDEGESPRKSCCSR